MAKIIIEMEAEISDLACFYPDSPKGISLQNVAEFLRTQLHVLPIEKILSLPQDGSPVSKALRKHAGCDKLLGERLVTSMRIKLVK